MKSFNFILILADVTVLTEEMAEKLYAAGCDDASPSSSEGVVEVEFDREAESESAAIDSARADVEKAGFRVRSIVRLPS